MMSTYLVPPVRIVVLVLFEDGYPMQDVIMRWKNETTEDSVHGVEDVEIPQFTMVEHRIISTVEDLTTG